MRVYVLRRLLGIVPTVLMITFVVFVMMRSVPGDPVVALLGDAYDEQDAIKVRASYGLDQPILVQYAIWLGKLARGDWGVSYMTGRPVLKDVLVRLPVTLELIVLSMGVALAIAVPAAIIGALRQNTWADYTATTIAMIGVSIPEFFIGVLLLLVFSIGLGGLLPSSGWTYLPGTCPTMVCGASLWGNAQHVLLPAIALGVGRAAILTRLLRASMLEVIRKEYVTTARAKGLSERPVVLKHALKNALIPTVTVMGLQVGFLIGGAIVVETLFAMPGLGTFGIDAIIARDYQQVQGFALLTALAFVVMNLVVDLTYTFERPSWDHPLGTDQLGRDMLSRVIHGTRISLLVGVSSVLLALFVGVPFGMIAGFYGGRVDTLIMRVMDLILAFPIYLLAIILMVMFTPTAGLIGTMKVTGAIAIVRIPIYARLVRGSVLSIKEKEYVEACRALGVRDPWILFRHVLPNCLAPIIVTTTLGIATSIIVEATLSFLGLGTQPPTPSWGWDLKANISFIQANAWLSLFPGLAIFVTVLGFNLFGDGLRDALDPRLK